MSVTGHILTISCLHVVTNLPVSALTSVPEPGETPAELFRYMCANLQVCQSSHPTGHTLGEGRSAVNFPLLSFLVDLSLGKSAQASKDLQQGWTPVITAVTSLGQSSKLTLASSLFYSSQDPTACDHLLQQTNGTQSCILGSALREIQVIQILIYNDLIWKVSF